MKEERLSDEDCLRRALILARKGLGHTRPNPAVGAVIAKDGRLLGEGWHRRAGGDHAEVVAIKDALRRGVDSLSGASIYVTLEPCSRPGRVGACTDAIAAAGLSRVVYACSDPNPKNRGRAARVLAKRGVCCSRWRGAGDIGSQAQSLVRAFAKHVTTGLPYVTVKLAMSLDGKICDNRGDAKWVSSAAARRTTGRLRECVDAIMVGGETVRRDNPSLLSHGRRNDDLVRVVVSRSGNLPSDAQIFTDGKNPTLVFPDAAEAMRALGEQGLTHILCEGGLSLATSLAEQGFVDEWIAVLAPKVIGTRPIADATPIGGVACLQDW